MFNFFLLLFCHDNHFIHLKQVLWAVRVYPT